MEKYHGFENWFKANKYVSWKSYLSFMRQIEKDLGNIDLEKICFYLLPQKTLDRIGE